MVIDLSRLRVGDKVDIDELIELDSDLIIGREASFVEGSRVSGYLICNEDNVFVNVVVTCTVKTICDLCSDDATVNVRANISEYFYELDESNKDAEYTYSENRLNLSPIIRERVVLAIPTRILCKDDCKGLCLKCGANLNRETCRCHIVEPEKEQSFERSLEALLTKYDTGGAKYGSTKKKS